MPIYLNKQQKDYLKFRLANILKSDFIGHGILKEIETDNDRLEKIDSCNHKIEKYEGKKESCVYCGKFCSETWELEK